ncbi:MAG TPA: hypothetical protein VEL76_21860, partial [Gemmataceae bacterium]|nr:hypothetical protein [Gemmataceae bacterium]
MMTTITCPGCTRRLSLPKDVLGLASQCPRCGATFTATETVDKLGTTLTVQAGDTREDPAFGALLREAEIEAQRQALGPPPPAADEPEDWRRPAPTAEPSWEPEPRSTERRRAWRGPSASEWEPGPAPAAAGGRKVVGWILVVGLGLLLGWWRSESNRRHAPPPLPAFPPLHVPAVANWGNLAGTWSDAQGSSLTIDAQGRVNGRIIEVGGFRELKIGLGDAFGGAHLRKDGLGVGSLNLQVMNIDAAGGVEHCRLTFHLLGNQE